MTFIYPAPCPNDQRVGDLEFVHDKGEMWGCTITSIVSVNGINYAWYTTEEYYIS